MGAGFTNERMVEWSYQTCQGYFSLAAPEKARFPHPGCDALDNPITCEQLPWFSPARIPCLKTPPQSLHMADGAKSRQHIHHFSRTFPPAIVPRHLAKKGTQNPPSKPYGLTGSLLHGGLLNIANCSNANGDGLMRLDSNEKAGLCGPARPATRYIAIEPSDS